MRMDVDHRDEGLPRCGKLANVDVPGHGIAESIK
jgi:hypothetical protein